MGPIADFIIEHNRKQSEIFCSPDQQGRRFQYRAKHPTEISALKCMDGRLNMPVITELPPGIIQPYRTMGGRFNLGWFYFGQLIENWYLYSIGRGRDCLVLITYHWSKGNEHRGCKGFNYDTNAAKEHVAGLAKQFERVFGQNHAVLYPVPIGIETDEDSLTIHGQSDTQLNIVDALDLSEDNLKSELQKLFPDMKQQILNDFLPLLTGNQKHVRGLRKSPRSDIDAKHRENILAVGRGFSWLHFFNKAFIIGPFEEEWGKAIAIAATLLLDNVRSGRINPNDGVLLLAAGTFRESAGAEMPRAIEKTKRLTQYALEIIKTHVPELLPYLDVMSGIVNLNTQRFTQIPQHDQKITA